MGSDLPSVSVVMPTYNADRYLGQAIDSILSQTHQAFELLVVDDGSTDDTPGLLASYAESDPRVRVISQSNQGVSAALNRGIADASAAWVAIMHSDDVALSGRIERQLRAAAEMPDVVAWGTYAFHIGANGKRLGLGQVGFTTREEFRSARARGKPIWLIHPTSLLRRDVLLQVGGYDPFFDCGEDLDLFSRMADRGPVLALPEPLLLYRVHSESNTLRRFARMTTLTEYIAARERAKAMGGEPVAWEAFEALQSHQSPMRKARNALKDSGAYRYRRFACEIAAEHPVRAAWFLAGSIICSPGYALRRIRQQRLGTRARRLLSPNGAK
jgi:glycosyltransferase involved in cell wall biosynthesis